MSEPLPLLTAGDLRRLAEPHATRQPCPACAGLVCPGWEVIPGGFDRAHLRPVGTLRVAGDTEPTLDEYRPGGVRTDAPEAPVALGFHPYNRCEVWQCGACGRPFLRYTEYGGYYQDERIRELRADQVVGDTAL